MLQTVNTIKTYDVRTTVTLQHPAGTEHHAGTYVTFQHPAATKPTCRHPAGKTLSTWGTPPQTHSDSFALIETNFGCRDVCFPTEGYFFGGFVFRIDFFCDSWLLAWLCSFAPLLLCFSASLLSCFSASLLY